jgi:adenosylcobinamide-GDP ribazoletransferase
VNGLVLAARYLTILPLPGAGHREMTGLGSAAVWFPVIGVGLGAVLVAADLVASSLFPALLSALLTVTAWKLLTGGLHLDGLADCLDGLLGHDAEQRLAIMRDSRIGAFAAVGLVLFLMIDIVALSELPAGPRWRVLLAAPAVARATPPCLARLFPPARGTGQGADFASTMPRWAWAPVLAMAAGVAGVVLGVVGLVGTFVAFAVALMLARFLSGRLGGITGDVFGAAVEAAELALVLTVSAWIHARL